MFVFNDPTSSVKSSEYEENISCFAAILNMKEEQNTKLVYVAKLFGKESQTTATGFILPCKKSIEKQKAQK